MIQSSLSDKQKIEIDRETKRALSKLTNLEPDKIKSRLKQHFQFKAFNRYTTEHKNEIVLSQQLTEINHYFVWGEFTKK